MQSDIHAAEDYFAGDQLRPVEVISLLYCLHLNINNGESLEKSIFFQVFSKSISRFFDTIKLQFWTENIKIHVVGSVSEGSISNSYISDIDLLLYVNDYECCDDHLNPNDKFKTVYIADRIYASPGYTLIIEASKYKESLKWKGVDALYAPFLESKDVFQGLSSRVSICGPAIRTTFQKAVELSIKPSWLSDNNAKLLKLLPGTEADLVPAILFHSKPLETSWAQRKRMRGWPSAGLIEEIFELHGHVVPVGMKGSRFEQYEWRICYTLLENKLVCSLNEVQIVLYIELKRYAKLSGCLTSYMIKNIVFWMAECLPSHYFQSKYFIPLVRSALVVLQKCVEKKSLPNYMIPSRNLFAGKLDDEMERQKLIDFLSSSSGKDYTVPVTCHNVQRLLNTVPSENADNSFPRTCFQIGTDLLATLPSFKCPRLSNMSEICKNADTVLSLCNYVMYLKGSKYPFFDFRTKLTTISSLLDLLSTQMIFDE